MSKYKKNPPVVDAITFDDLVTHGRTQTEDTNGMPWSFDYAGHPITHENDQCYLIPCTAGGSQRSVFNQQLTPSDMLITDTRGGIWVLDIDELHDTYTPLG